MILKIVTNYSDRLLKRESEWPLSVLLLINLGTFSTTKIKRNPKDERISIELRDVFVKYMNVPFENYYPQVQCELIKQERNNLPEKYKK